MQHHPDAISPLSLQIVRFISDISIPFRSFETSPTNFSNFHSPLTRKRYLYRVSAYYFKSFFPAIFIYYFWEKNREEKKAKKKKNSSIREFECLQRTLKGKSITYISPIYKLSGLSRSQSFSNREAEPIHPYEADNRSTRQDLPTLESKCLQGKMRDSSRSKSRTTTTTTTATSLANRTKRSLHVLTALIDKITGTEYRF